jgi:MFS family permease
MASVQHHQRSLSLGMGLMEVIPAVSMALFAGHIVDQRKKSLLVKCILAFSVISFGLFLLTWPAVVQDYSLRTILYSIYFLVFLGLVRAFLGPTIFSLLSLLVPKKVYPNAATWSSSVWQIANVMGPAFAGFSITDWRTLVSMYRFCLFYFCIAGFITNR